MDMLISMEIQKCKRKISQLKNEIKKLKETIEENDELSIKFKNAINKIETAKENLVSISKKTQDGNFHSKSVMSVFNYLDKSISGNEYENARNSVVDAYNKNLKQGDELAESLRELERQLKNEKERLAMLERELASSESEGD